MVSKVFFVTLSFLMIVQSTSSMHQRLKNNNSKKYTMAQPLLPSQELIDHQTEIAQSNDEFWQYMKHFACAETCCVTLFGVLVCLGNADGPYQ